MKIRNGFVSNSSSSSYVIAYMPKDKCKECGHTRNNFMERFSDDSESEYNDTKLISTDINEIIEQFYFGDENPEKYPGEYYQLQAEGYTIAHIRVSYNDDTIKQELNTLIDTGQIKILNTND